MKTVAIIGCGKVGSTIAYSLYHKNCCNIILLNHNVSKAIGNTLDIQDSWRDYYTHKITFGNYDDVVNADIIINCAGDSSLLATQNRLAELDNSRRISYELIDKLNKVDFKGIFINTMNPCNEITELFLALNISKNKLIGTGTLLETQRLRSIVYQKYSIITSSYIVGIHGNDNCIICKDSICEQHEDELLNLVHHRVWDIYNNKGYTNFGICESVLTLVSAILNNTRTELCVVSGLNTYNTTALVSVPSIVGKDGVQEINTYKEVVTALNKMCLIK